MRAARSPIPDSGTAAGGRERSSTRVRLPRLARAARRPGTIWPEPDLAVIQLQGDIAHPCVRLGAREPEEGSHMIAAAGARRSGRSRRLLLRHDGVHGEVPVLDAPEKREVRAGDVRRSGTRPHHWRGLRRSKAGGPRAGRYAVPVRLAYDLPGDVTGEMLRSHDRYHDGHRDWVWAQRALWDAKPPAAKALLRRTAKPNCSGCWPGCPEPIRPGSASSTVSAPVRWCAPIRDPCESCAMSRCPSPI